MPGPERPLAIDSMLGRLHTASKAAAEPGSGPRPPKAAARDGGAAAAAKGAAVVEVFGVLAAVQYLRRRPAPWAAAARGACMRCGGCWCEGSPMKGTGHAACERLGGGSSCCGCIKVDKAAGETQSWSPGATPGTSALAPCAIAASCELQREGNSCCSCCCCCCMACQAWAATRGT